MLDKVIHKHIDEMDAITEALNERIDAAINTIDIDQLMIDPEGYLTEFVNELQVHVLDGLAERAYTAGEDVANEVMKKEIKVDESNDPQKNKKIFE